MFPWKLVFRFLSAFALMATGGYAAGHELPLPVFDPPPAASAPASPAADPATTPTSAPAQVDGSTTTTGPSVVPVADPAPTTSTTEPATPAKPSTTTTTVPKTSPAVVTPPGPPPAHPVDDDASKVCAAAASATCGPADPAPSADHAARVQRCQAWWNALADALDHNGQPKWADKAREIAGRCDAMITRWEHLQQEWAKHLDKADHNGDGHPDNGKGPGHDQGNQSSPPPAPPRTQPQSLSSHADGRH